MINLLIVFTFLCMSDWATLHASHPMTLMYHRFINICACTYSVIFLVGRYFYKWRMYWINYAGCDFLITLLEFILANDQRKLICYVVVNNYCRIGHWWFLVRTRFQRISFLMKNWQNDEKPPFCQKYWYLAKFNKISLLNGKTVTFIIWQWISGNFHHTCREYLMATGTIVYINQ